MMVTASKAESVPRYRSLEDTFYSDIRPATPEQQLPKSVEKKADAQASYMEGLLLEEEGDYEGALAAYSRSLTARSGRQSAISSPHRSRLSRNGETSRTELMSSRICQRRVHASRWLISTSHISI